MWSPAAASLEKKSQPFPYSSSCPSGLLKVTPRATMSRTWKESLGSRPAKHPPQNLFLFALVGCLKPSSPEPWLSSHRKPRFLQEHLLLVMLPFPASGGSSGYGQVPSAFWKSKGTLSNMGSVCVYTSAASVGFSLLFSLFSSQPWLCTWDHWAAVCISLVLPLLAASVRPCSPECRDLAARRSNKHSCSRVPPARRSPSPRRPRRRWKRAALRSRCKYP